MPVRYIRHKYLRKLFDLDEERGLPPEYLGKIKRILSVLNEIKSPHDLSGIPGLRCHPLKGDKKGFFSIKISKNIRVIFRMDGQDVYDVNLEDYH